MTDFRLNALFVIFHDDFAVCWCFDVIINDDFSNTVDGDGACSWIFYADDVSFYIALHTAIFEREVSILSESAVFEHEVFAIAERLCASDVAAHEAQIARVPCEVFSIDFTVIDCAVVRFPKCVFCVENRIAYNYVFRVLE